MPMSEVVKTRISLRSYKMKAVSSKFEDAFVGYDFICYIY